MLATFFLMEKMVIFPTAKQGTALYTQIINGNLFNRNVLNEKKKKKDLKEFLRLLISGYSVVLLINVILFMFSSILAIFILDLSYSFYGLVIVITILMIPLIITIKEFKWTVKDTLDFFYQCFYRSLILVLVAVFIKMISTLNLSILKEWVFMLIVLSFILVKKRKKIQNKIRKMKRKLKNYR